MQLFSLLALPLAVSAAEALSRSKQTLDWTLSWKTVNPDGLKDRPVVVINDQFPLPVVRVKQGERIVINVFNNLTEPARNTTMHFHGMFQNGTNEMDGPTFVNQCPQPPNTSFTYDFVVDQPGTYWYHAHVDDLYPDGYRQMFIVEDECPYDYDEELSFSMSDWYHELYATIRDHDFFTLYNPSGAEPVPKSLLINDTTKFAAEIKPDTTYRLRIANTATFSSFFWFIENQNVTVIEVDGVFVEPYETPLLYLSTAQRYSVLFTTGKKQSVYRAGMIADSALYDVVPSDLQLNHTAFFHTKHHDELKDMTVKDMFHALPLEEDATLGEFESGNIIRINDLELVPYDRMPLLPDPDHEITLTMELTNLMDGKNYAFFNGISYTAPKVPTLYSVLDAPDLDAAENATVYGTYTGTYVVQHNDVVQLALNNYDSGIHPFHLHGHNFQVLLQAPEINGGEDEEDFNPYDPTKNHKFAKYPLRRDVVAVRPFSHILLRWRADNPGVWLFHCHIEWHLTQGLAIQFVEAPSVLRQNQKIPKQHLDTCKAAGVPYKGNAAGNANFFDLKGENRQAEQLPEGFTAKGYFALVLSIVVALTGIWYIVWFSTDDD